MVEMTPMNSTRPRTRRPWAALVSAAHWRRTTVRRCTGVARADVAAAMSRNSSRSSSRRSSRRSPSRIPASPGASSPSTSCRTCSSCCLGRVRAADRRRIPHLHERLHERLRRAELVGAREGQGVLPGRAVRRALPKSTNGVDDIVTVGTAKRVFNGDSTIRRRSTDPKKLSLDAYLKAYTEADAEVHAPPHDAAR